jgi:hypothetical protein
VKAWFAFPRTSCVTFRRTLVESLALEDFRALFRRHRDAIHLETHETYSVSQEDEPFRRFMAGEPVDFGYRQGYLGLIRAVTAGGMTVRRVRVVTEPLNDYARFLLHIAAGNVEAGEDVRYLARQNAADLDLPGDDCWLFDAHTLILTTFEGRSTGFVVCDDPAVVNRYREACSKAWERAVPYAAYVHGR